jgi:hypothetical protein
MEIPLSGYAFDSLAVLTVMFRPREDPSPHMERWRAAMHKEGAVAATQECGGGLIAYLATLGDTATAQLLQAESIEACRRSSGPPAGQFIGGWVAGEMLLHLLTTAEHAPEHASVNKACHLVIRNLSEARLLYSGSKAPCSRQTVWSAWTSFRPAAHLWAAFNLTTGWPDWDTFAAAYPNGTLSVLLPGLLALLSVAEALRRLAEGHKIVAPGELWRVPATIPLLPVNVTVPPPTDWILEQLQGYRARGSLNRI